MLENIFTLVQIVAGVAVIVWVLPGRKREEKEELCNSCANLNRKRPKKTTCFPYECRIYGLCESSMQYCKNYKKRGGETDG